MRVFDHRSYVARWQPAHACDPTYVRPFAGWDAGGNDGAGVCRMAPNDAENPRTPSAIHQLAVLVME
jgi:hypothetical protein